MFSLACLSSCLYSYCCLFYVFFGGHFLFDKTLSLDNLLSLVDLIKSISIQFNNLSSSLSDAFSWLTLICCGIAEIQNGLFSNLYPSIFTAFLFLRKSKFFTAIQVLISCFRVLLLHVRKLIRLERKRYTAL